MSRPCCPDLRQSATRTREQAGALQALSEAGDFHAAGATKRERLLMAGNQLGKTWPVASKPPCTPPVAIPMMDRAALRSTDCWLGVRRDQRGCARHDRSAFWSAAQARRHRLDSEGRIAELVPARGIADALDTIRVRHVSGGISIDQPQELFVGPREIPGRDAGLGLVRRGAAGRHLHRRPDPNERRRRAGLG